MAIFLFSFAAVAAAAAGMAVGVLCGRGPLRGGCVSAALGTCGGCEAHSEHALRRVASAD